MTQDKFVNGLNVDLLNKSMDDMRSDPTLGKFVFKANNEWIDGAHCRSTIKDFDASNEPDVSRHTIHVLESDEPAALLGQDYAPNATETLLHALAACLNASVIYHAAAQGIRVEELEFEIQGHLDLNGFLGVDEEVPSNFGHIEVKCKVKADATIEQMQELCEYAQKRSPVFNTVIKPVPVNVTLEATRTTVSSAH